jgi:hypothetical protein
MAKKPTKKKIEKVIVAQVPKPEVPVAVENIIGALASLQASQGWALIVKILNDNITYLEKAILEKIDPLTKEVLSDAEVEILRTKRSLNIDLRDTPATYSKVVKDAGAVPVDYDPYFKTNDDILKAGRTPAQDDKGA